ncbi:MAG: beta-ketoacyl synthase N-terminal-like domain-containing protein [bacterium]|nr:beta-ketoacyl synthase N-terminal-like domain-containing protein [bacterium]
MMKGREVWITGVGTLTPAGANQDAFWKSLLTGRSAISEHPAAGDSDLPPGFHLCGRVEGHEEPPEFPKKLASQRKFLVRGSILGLHTAREAIAQAGLEMADILPERKSLYVASGDFTRLGHLDFYSSLRDAANAEWNKLSPKALNEAVLHKVNPFFLLEGLANNLFSFLSSCYEMMGPNGSISSLSSCGAQGVEFCERVVRMGEADVGLAVGCGNWENALLLYELNELGVLSRGAKGPGSFRPFDVQRDGFLVGEGAAALVFEAAEHARARGAKPLGRILGTGNLQEGDPHRHIPVPAEATLEASRMALDEGGLAPEDLAFVISHGSGTRKGDRNELRALSRLLGEKAGDVPLTALKPYTGHMGAGSDVAELAAGLRAAREGMLPGTPGFEKAESEFAHLSISAEARPVRGGVFLSTSHGISGQASATVLGVV